MVEAALAHLGDIEVRFSNAGILVEGTAGANALEDWIGIVAVRLTGMFLGAEPHCYTSSSARLVITASASGLGGRSMATYNAVKGGVIDQRATPRRSRAIACAAPNRPGAPTPQDRQSRL